MFDKSASAERFIGIISYSIIAVINYRSLVSIDKKFRENPRCPEIGAVGESVKVNIVFVSLATLALFVNSDPSMKYVFSVLMIVTLGSTGLLWYSARNWSRDHYPKQLELENYVMDKLFRASFGPQLLMTGLSLEMFIRAGW